ncbi:fungal-specific transcription factor domain-containing protein [Penicillium atrosanguineum]|uniref:Fungal-specific transcription factor domain-containing protein n=1 Tax=Penicillium atrosanguineum TaxID=1132637 RepID=A0A9W9PT59_9EURO|nr:fungal-specific transcription factor domain-containing protein [Penicillium atrosanguineum]
MCLDRVPHLQDKFCEISTLTEDDFKEPSGPNLNDSFGKTVHEQVLFVIHYVQLARTANLILVHTASVRITIYVFERKCVGHIDSTDLQVRPLPNLFKFRVCNVSKHYFTYLPTHHSNSQYQLLFHRKCPDAAQNMGPGSPIFEICTRLFRMLEDLATSGNLFSVAGHALPAVMASVCFHIVNTSKGDTQVKSISEHRARFCLLILKDLRASWPIIASVYPFFTSMFRRYSGVSFSDCEKDELCCSQPTQRTGDPAIISEDVFRAPEGDTSLYGRFLHDENSAVLNSTFPFTYLFEDVFLTPSLIDTTL